MALVKRLTVRAFRALVRALPRDARDGFEDEMAVTFGAALDASAHPLVTAASCFADAARCVACEWWRVMTARPRKSARQTSRRSEETTMESMVQDLRYALRQFSTRPGFAAVVVLVLGLGIGATTAVFSVVNGVLLKPLPYAEPDRLVLVWGHMSATEVTKAPWSGPDLIDFRDRGTAFEAFAAASGMNATLTGDFEPEPVKLGMATANLFDVLGIEPVLGRSFRESDQQNLDPVLFAPGSEPPAGVVMLSYDLWENRFGGDPGVVGKSVLVAGQLMEVIGVAPENFRLLLPEGSAVPPSIDVWSAIAFDLSKGPRDAQWLTVVGRLADGVTPSEAGAEMTAVASQFRDENQFHANVGMEIDVVPMLEDVVGHTEPILYALLGAVGFVLLIACANVANLHLVRAQSRHKELAIRSAIGGSRSRIVRQMFIESIVLALAGGMAGLVFARLGINALAALRPEHLPRVDAISMDVRVLAFAFAATVVSAVLFGLFPAFESSRAAPNASLSERGGSSVSGGSSGRMRDVLVVGEVAVALFLLIGSGLMIRTFFELSRVDPGFVADGVITTNVALPGLDGKGPDERLEFHLSLKEKLEALPGVEAVGALTPLPLTGGGQFWFGPYAIHEASDEEWSRNEVDYRISLPGLLDAIGTKLLAGRELDAHDARADAPRRVMIDDVLAADAWPGASPVGERIMVMKPNPSGGVQFDRYWAEVVGVVEHIRYDDIRRDGRGTIYFPFTDWYFADLNYLVRAEGDAETLAPAIRAAIRDADPDIPAAGVGPLSGFLDTALAPTRFALVVMSVFAGVALCLAVVGLYGVLSYMVRDRRKELAVRIAFGAERGNILSLILGRGLVLAAVGVGSGLLASMGLTRGLQSLLYGVSAIDPATYAGIAVALMAVAVLACYLPARRATEIDPIETLRTE